MRMSRIRLLVVSVCLCRAALCEGLPVAPDMELVELHGTQRIETDTLWKSRHVKIFGDLVFADGTLTVEDCLVEIMCEYARHVKYVWEGGALVTRNTVIGGTKRDGVTAATVFELYDGRWEATGTTVQYSTGIVFSYSSKGILDADGLVAGENPDSVIICGRGEARLRNSRFDIALHMPAHTGATVYLDMPINTSISRSFNDESVTGIEYVLELKNHVVPNLWFVFFVSVSDNAPVTTYEIGNCPILVPGIIALNLKATAVLPTSWIGSHRLGELEAMPEGTIISVGSLRVVTRTPDTVLAAWGVYLDGPDTDVTVSGSTCIAELIVNEGKCRVIGMEGTNDMWVACTTVDAGKGADLLIRNAHLSYFEPSIHYKQITAADGASVRLENVVFGDRLELIVKGGGAISIEEWSGNREGVKERNDGGVIEWSGIPPEQQGK